MSGVRDYSVIATGHFSSNKQVVPGAGPSGGVGNTVAGGVFHGMELISDGTHTCAVTLYHGTSAVSGNEIAYLTIAATTVPPSYISLLNPVACPDGIFAAPTGTGVVVNVWYSVGS